MTAPAALSRAEPTEPAPPDHCGAGTPGDRLPEPPDAVGDLVDGVTARWRPHERTEARARLLGVEIRRWPTTEPPTGWRDDAACRGVDVAVADAMVEVRSQAEATALVGRFCSSCPVASACFDSGRSTHSYGIWGGVVLTGGRIAGWRPVAKRRTALAEAIEATEPTEITMPIEPTELTMPIEQTELTMPIEPTELTMPIEPTELTMPIEPTEITMPIEPPERRRGQRVQPRRLTRAERRR